MTTKRYVQMMVFFMSVSNGFSLVQACMATFINDSNGPVGIFNQNEEFFIIAKNDRRRFGGAHQHARFSVFVPQKQKGKFSKVYECIQNTCGKNGNPHVKFSELESNAGQELHLFTITKFDQSLPMVERLPIMQQKETCIGCRG